MASCLYGEHYGGKIKKIKINTKISTLKSHFKNGFAEPLLYFSPSIGISEITMPLIKQSFLAL